jgi:hypothetical protein
VAGPCEHSKDRYGSTKNIISLLVVRLVASQEGHSYMELLNVPLSSYLLLSDNCHRHSGTLIERGFVALRGGLKTRGIKIPSHVQRLPKSRMRRVIPPVPHMLTSSWRSA